MDHNFCTKCGVAVAPDSKYCQRCGEPLDTAGTQSPPMFSPLPEPHIHSYAGADYPEQPLIAPTYQPQRYYGPQGMVGRKNPGTAAVLSFLIVGLGQIYNGQILKGLAMLVVSILFGITVVGLIVSFLIWLYGVFDAYGTAKRTNRERGYPE